MASPKPSEAPDLSPLFPLIARLRAGAIIIAFLAVTLAAMPWQALLLRVSPQGARRFPQTYHRLVARIFGLKVRVIGQLPICWDPDRDKAIRRAHDQFRWFGGGWAVNADLPTTAGFDGASQFVRPEDVAESIPCGPDLDAIVDAVRKYAEAGFTDIALVQIGDENQDLFLKEAAGSLLEKLRSESN